MAVAISERTLEPLERHRLTAFYEDGEEHMKRSDANARDYGYGAVFIGYSHQAVSGHSRTFSECLWKSMTEAVRRKKLQSALAVPAGKILQARATGESWPQ